MDRPNPAAQCNVLCVTREEVQPQLFLAQMASQKCKPVNTCTQRTKADHAIRATGNQGLALALLLILPA